MWDTLQFHNKELVATSSCTQAVQHNRLRHLQPKEEISPPSKLKSLDLHAESISSSFGIDAKEASVNQHPAPSSPSRAPAMIPAALSPALAMTSSPTSSGASLLLSSVMPIPFASSTSIGRIDEASSTSSLGRRNIYAQDCTDDAAASDFDRIFDDAPPLPSPAEATSSIVGESIKAASLGDFSIGDELVPADTSSVEDFLEMFAS